MDLEPTYRDSFGHPLVRSTYNFTDNERKIMRYIAEKALVPMIAEMNPQIQTVSGDLADYNIVPYQSTHANGGTVMGSTPADSVVNRYCQAWDASNLFVVGAGNFPQNPGYNPTGTVGAIVTRYPRPPGPLVLAERCGPYPVRFPPAEAPAGVCRASRRAALRSASPATPGISRSEAPARGKSRFASLPARTLPGHSAHARLE